ncbi:MAG: hypothetical protein DCC71_06265 [Proteobacteria bacterium]|nr:MAG: hypothetical protein DCC71_06265 [Pseudomonadota bacterium]
MEHQARERLVAIWGGEQTGDDGSESGVVNGTIRFDATDRLAMYLNGDNAWSDGDPAAWGVTLTLDHLLTDNLMSVPRLVTTRSPRTTRRTRSSSRTATI